MQKLGDASITSVVNSLKLEESEVVEYLEIFRVHHLQKYVYVFKMDILHSQLVVGSKFLSCWIHVVIYFSCYYVVLYSMFLASLLCWSGMSYSDPSMSNNDFLLL